MIGDGGKGFDRRARQLTRDRPLDAQLGGKIGRGAKGPAASQTDQVDAASVISIGKLAQQFSVIGLVVKMLRQRRFVERDGGGEQQRLDQPQLLRPRAQFCTPSLEGGGLRK